MNCPACKRFYRGDGVVKACPCGYRFRQRVGLGTAFYTSNRDLFSGCSCRAEVVGVLNARGDAIKSETLHRLARQLARKSKRTTADILARIEKAKQEWQKTT